MTQAVCAPFGALTAAIPRAFLVFNSATNAPKRLTALDTPTIARSAGVATVTMATAHWLKVGDVVVLSGATQSEYNGTFEVTTVPSTTTFTFIVDPNAVTPATGAPAGYAVIWCHGATFYGRKTDLRTDSVSRVWIGGSSVNDAQQTPVEAGGETPWPMPTGVKLGLHDLYLDPVLANEGVAISLY